MEDFWCWTAYEELERGTAITAGDIKRAAEIFARESDDLDAPVPEGFVRDVIVNVLHKGRHYKVWVLVNYSPTFYAHSVMEAEEK